MRSSWWTGAKSTRRWACRVSGRPSARAPFFTHCAKGWSPSHAEVRFHATDLDAGYATRDRLLPPDPFALERGDQLHHPKDRTWLEDRHSVKNKRTGGIVTMLRSVACGMVRKARCAGSPSQRLLPRAHRVLQSHPKPCGPTGYRRRTTSKRSCANLRRGSLRP